ncbi:MFS transporter [Clostridium sp. CCUG 7971]|uniref:MFS transporter n=1 Tax=Clostridium sp. CCUG 7971 TaxID=2811414 RepID=UPI00257035CA|nr:MFS transporter [Clostridium sp. CCUG 7971]
MEGKAKSVDNISVVPKKYRIHFIMLISCFVLWGLLNNMTDNLVPAFGKIFMLEAADASLTQVAFYGSYAVLALPAAILIKKYSYRHGVLVGLGLYIIGAIGYIPAAMLQNFNLFLASVFVLAGGLSILETTCNPYVISLGDEETSVRRLNLAQAFNPLGSLTGIILAKYLILGNLNSATYEERIAMSPEALSAIRSNELLWVCVPYVGLVIIAIVIWCFFKKNKDSEKILQQNFT